MIGEERYVSIVISFWKCACGLRAAFEWSLIAMAPNISGRVGYCRQYALARVAYSPGKVAPFLVSNG